MTSQLISGPGVGLPAPQALYPANPNTTPYTAATNQFAIKPSGTLTIPAGKWSISLNNSGASNACSIQYLDPVQLQWINTQAPAASMTAILPWSDGFSWRVANLSDAHYGASISNSGSGYAQATTTVTPTSGNSTWQPIVGGAVGSVSLVAGGAGSGFTKRPFVFIPSPPAPGVAAVVSAEISGGSLSSFAIAQAGAGYQVNPTVVIIPDPTDPNLAAGLITNATATATLTGTGSITAILLVNFGQAITAATSLTVNGAGTSATAGPVPATVPVGSTITATLQPF